jgi:hypothetical protein
LVWLGWLCELELLLLFVLELLPDEGIWFVEMELPWPERTPESLGLLPCGWQPTNASAVAVINNAFFIFVP